MRLGGEGEEEVGSEGFVCIVSPVRPVRPASIPSAVRLLYIFYINPAAAGAWF